MKRYGVAVTESAEKDLAGIVDYVAHVLKNRSAALGLVDEFERLLDSLEQLPGAHPLVRDELLALAGYRWAAIGSYMVFFTIDEDAAAVYIERILHGTRNWRAIV